MHSTRPLSTLLDLYFDPLDFTEFEFAPLITIFGVVDDGTDGSKSDLSSPLSLSLSVCFEEEDFGVLTDARLDVDFFFELDLICWSSTNEVDSLSEFEMSDSQVTLVSLKSYNSFMSSITI